MNPQKNTSQAEVRLQVLLLLLLLVTTLIVSRVARDHPQVKNPPETEEAAGEASSGEVFRIVFEDPEALQAWRCLSFAGKSTYSIKKKPAGDLALHARSQNNYSSLFPRGGCPAPCSAHARLAIAGRGVSFGKEAVDTWPGRRK